MKAWMGRLGAIWVAVYLLPVPFSHGQANVEVDGLGFFRNFGMDRRLAFLSGVPESENRELDFTVVEDTAFVLLQLLTREGYPGPEVKATVRYGDGSEGRFTWTLPFEPVAEADRPKRDPEFVGYHCEPGILRYYRSVQVTGVHSIDSKLVDDFFIPSSVLFPSRRDRAFTQSNLDGRVSRLLGTLRDSGYPDARERRREVDADPQSGAVDVFLEFDQGPIHRIGKLKTIVLHPDGKRQVDVTEEHAGALFRGSWLRERRQDLLNAWYARGFPDARTRVERHPRKPADPSGDSVMVDVVLHLETGPHVGFAGTAFRPEGLLKKSVLNRQIDLPAGGDFNLIAIEEGRRRLLSLGVLREVDVEEEPAGPRRRMARYNLEPLPARTLTLIAGWGSYEMGRAGIRWEHLNPWGRAHRYELLLKQSFKSSVLEGHYIIPHFFDQNNTGYVRGGYAYREEIDFERTTAEIVTGATRDLKLTGAEVSVEFAWEQLDTTRDSSPDFASQDTATVASVSLHGVIDRRDSALYPQKGYALSMTSKTALESFGGESNFQKLEFSATGHRPVGNTLTAHLSLGYGILFSRSPTERNLPFNERFFPGGENSVRGYRRGEASPLSVNGEVIGAEAYAIANAEIEQRVLRNISIVLFWDGVAISERQKAFPDDDVLYSVGIGLRWRTIVGPVRLEYGLNPDPRPDDPEGTLHLAVGYPF